MANMQEVRIVCVVVTFNRLAKLKKAIDAYEKQSMPFDTLVIVDNHSTDGTEQYLEEWGKSNSKLFNKHVIHLQENRGGSGGFYEGERYAMTLNPDWIFVADDDAYPELNMISKVCKYVKSHNTKDVSAICSSVVSTDGGISLGHRARYSVSMFGFFDVKPVGEEEYKQEEFNCSFFSYVGTFMNVCKLKEVGLVNPNFFIYSDDAEHSLRLGNVGEIICLPYICVSHDSGVENESNTTNMIVSWRDYYLIRNQIYMLRLHFPLTLPRMIYVFLKSVIRENAKKRDVYYSAIFDGIFGRLRLNNVYKPGWTLKNQDI